MCVCVALGMRHALRMRYLVICGLPGSTIFFHIILRCGIPVVLGQ